MKSVEKYIIGILVFVAVGAMGAAVYFGVSADKNSSKKEENKQEEVLGNDKNDLNAELLNVNSDEVKSLYKKVDFNNDFMSINAHIKYWEMLSKDKVVAKDLSDKTRLLMAVNYKGSDLIKNGPGVYMNVDNLEYPNYVRYVEEQEIIDAFNKVFGDNATYHKVDALNICEHYVYESRDNRYVTYDGGCGDLFDYVYIEEILSAEKYSDRIEITTGVAYCSLYETACYRDYEQKEQIENLENNEDFNINDYLDDIYKYKYTFTKDDNSNDYYFYSVEKIKK